MNGRVTCSETRLSCRRAPGKERERKKKEWLKKERMKRGGVFNSTLTCQGMEMRIYVGNMINIKQHIILILFSIIRRLSHWLGYSAYSCFYLWESVKLKSLCEINVYTKNAYN